MFHTTRLPADRERPWGSVPERSREQSPRSSRGDRQPLQVAAAQEWKGPTKAEYQGLELAFLTQTANRRKHYLGARPAGETEPEHK